MSSSTLSCKMEAVYSEGLIHVLSATPFANPLGPSPRCLEQEEETDAFEERAVEGALRKELMEAMDSSVSDSESSVGPLSVDVAWTCV